MILSIYSREVRNKLFHKCSPHMFTTTAKEKIILAKVALYNDIVIEYQTYSSLLMCHFNAQQLMFIYYLYMR